MSRIPETRSVPRTHSAFATKRAVPPHVHRLDFLSCTNFVPKCNEHFERSLYFRTDVCTRMTRRIHIPGTYHTTAAATCTRSNTTECYCFLRLLAAVVRLHRTGTPACSRCVAVYVRIWSRRILHRYFLIFVQVFFLQINHNQPWNFMQQAYKQQQRDSVGTVSEGGCIISAVV